MALLAILSGLGLGLAVIGAYGVVAYSVARRTSELGIRAALGAQRGELLWLVIRQGMKPVLAGLVVGVVSALSLGRAARSLLFGIEPQDPLTLMGGLGVLGAVALLACLLPALRAIRIDRDGVAERMSQRFPPVRRLGTSSGRSTREIEKQDQGSTSGDQHRDGRG